MDDMSINIEQRKLNRVTAALFLSTGLLSELLCVSIV